MTPTEEEAQAAARVRRVGSNAISLLAAYVLPRVFTVGAVVVAARVLGTERFGAYGAAAAFAVILSILATLGMHPLLVRDLAREPALAPRLMRAAHLVKTLTGGLMLVLLYVIARWGIGLDQEGIRAALLLGVAYAIGSYVENLSAYFQAVERMHVWTEASALLGLVTGGLGALLVLTQRSVVWFCVAPIAGQAVALAWLLIRAPAEVRRGESARADDVGRLVRALTPFAAGFIVLTLHYKMDVLVLERLRGPGDVGLYTAGYKFVDVFTALVVVCIGALYPRLARGAQTAADRVEAGERWAGTRAAELALLAAVPAAGALHLAAQPAVALLFGSAYAGSAAVTGWLALGLPMLALNLLGGYLLGTAHRMGWMAALYGAALVLKTVLNVALIPALGPTGTAIAMVATEGTLAVGVLLVLRQFAHVAPGVRAVVAACGAAVLIPVAQLVDDPSGGMLAALGYTVAVAALYVSAGLVGPRERRVLTRAIRDRQVVADTP